MSVARVERYQLGNVHELGAEACARRVRKRVLAERRLGRAVGLFVDPAGNVYAPDAFCAGALLTRAKHPSWEVGLYQFPAPPPKSWGTRLVRSMMPRDATFPTVADIAEDLMFHVSQNVRKAA